MSLNGHFPFAQPQNELHEAQCMQAVVSCSNASTRRSSHSAIAREPAISRDATRSFTLKSRTRTLPSFRSSAPPSRRDSSTSVEPISTQASASLPSSSHAPSDIDLQSRRRSDDPHHASATAHNAPRNPHRQPPGEAWNVNGSEIAPNTLPTQLLRPPIALSVATIETQLAAVSFPQRENLLQSSNRAPPDPSALLSPPDAHPSGDGLNGVAKVLYSHHQEAWRETVRCAIQEDRIVELLQSKAETRLLRSELQQSQARVQLLEEELQQRQTSGFTNAPPLGDAKENGVGGGFRVASDTNTTSNVLSERTPASPPSFSSSAFHGAVAAPHSLHADGDKGEETDDGGTDTSAFAVDAAGVDSCSAAQLTATASYTAQLEAANHHLSRQMGAILRDTQRLQSCLQKRTWQLYDAHLRRETNYKHLLLGQQQLEEDNRKLTSDLEAITGMLVGARAAEQAAIRSRNEYAAALEMWTKAGATAATTGQGSGSVQASMVPTKGAVPSTVLATDREEAAAVQSGQHPDLGGRLFSRHYGTAPLDISAVATVEKGIYDNDEVDSAYRVAVAVEESYYRQSNVSNDSTAYRNPSIDDSMLPSRDGVAERHAQPKGNRSKNSTAAFQAFPLCDSLSNDREPVTSSSQLYRLSEHLSLPAPTFVALPSHSSSSMYAKGGEENPSESSTGERQLLQFNCSMLELELRNQEVQRAAEQQQFQEALRTIAHQRGTLDELEARLLQVTAAHEKLRGITNEVFRMWDTSAMFEGDGWSDSSGEEGSNEMTHWMP